MPTSTSHEGWLQVCVSRCQVVAGQVSHDHTHTMLSEIQGIVAAVPDTITVPDQLVVRSLIGQALGRILSAANTAQNLSCLFAANTGQGFMTHLHVRRVAAARRMLIESQRSVKEVAAAVGYRSVTQLDRYFKRVFALTPNAVRAGAHAMSQSPTSSCQQLYTLRKN